MSGPYGSTLVLNALRLVYEEHRLTLSHTQQVCGRRRRKHFDKMKLQLLKKVENIMVYGEFAHVELFLLLRQCFQKQSAAESLESVYMWDRVNGLLHSF